MKNKNIDKALKVVKENRKPILIIAGVIVLLLVIRLIYKNIAKITRKVKAETVTGTDVTGSIDFDTLCDQLYLAGPRRIGTDEASIYTVFRQLQTQADYYYLCNSWRSYWSNLNWFQRHNDSVFTDSYASLQAMLRDELTDSELQRCRDILVSNGITPDF